MAWAGAGRSPTLALCLLALVGCCHGQSVSITPSTLQVFALETNGTNLIPQWLTVTCEANGFTRGMVNWTRNGNDIMPGFGHVIHNNVLEYKIHHIHSVPQNISCEVDDAETGDIYTASVMFQSFQKPPTPIVVAGEVTTNSATFSVQFPKNHRGTATFLHVRYSGEKTVTLPRAPIKSSNEPVVVDSLSPGKTYTLSFYAASDDGIVSDYNNRTVTTKEFPEAVTVRAVSDRLHTSARVEWDSLEDRLWNDDSSTNDGQRLYRVSVEEGAVVVSAKNVSGRVQSHRLTGLTPRTSYTVTVVAISQYGVGQRAGKSKTTFTTRSSPQVRYIRHEVEGKSRTDFEYVFSAVVDGISDWPTATFFYYYSTDGNRSFSNENATAITVDIGGRKQCYVRASLVFRGNVFDDYSAGITFVTDSRIPRDPGLQAFPAARSVKLTWTTLDFNDGDPTVVTVFSIYFVGIRSLFPPKNTTFLEVDGLTPGTTYSVKASLVSKPPRGNDESCACSTVIFTTKSLAPETKVQFQVIPQVVALVLSWTALDTAEWNSPMNRAYTVKWQNSSGSSSSSDLPHSATSYTIKGLKPYMEYNVSVLAKNDIGDGPAEYRVHRTLEAAPSKVRPLNVAQLNLTSIHVSWGPPKHPNGLIRGYRVRLILLGDPSSERIRYTTETSEIFLDIKGNTDYSLSVDALTVAYGPSRSKVYTTAVGVPTSAPMLTPVDTTDVTSATLKWSDPQETRGDITGYSVYLTKSGESEVHVNVNMSALDRGCRYCSGKKHSYALTALDFDSSYTARISVATSAGDSPRSNSVTFYTLAGMPTEPLNLTVINSTSRSLTLHWLRPLEVKANKWGYTVQYNAKKFQVEGELGDDVVYILKGLVPFQTYSITVKTTNIAQTSDKSAETSGSTDLAGGGV